MKHNILIFSEDFPPYPGGIAQWAQGMAVGLYEAGNIVSVLTRERENENVQNAPYKIEYLSGRNWKRFRTQYCRKGFTNYLNKNDKPDIVISTTWNFARGINRITKKLNIKHILILHGLEVTRRMPLLKMLWLKKVLLECFLLLAVSQFTRERTIKRFKIKADKIKVLNNGVDIKKFQQKVDCKLIKNKYGLKNEIILLTLARVIERKGHLDVIFALPEVLKKEKNLKYIISGPQEEKFRMQLDKHIELLGLKDFVIFTGPVNEQEKISLYQICDLYIMPSKELEAEGDTEGFGITFLEANACAKPVIGSYSGGIPDAVADGNSGFLVSEGSPEQIADKILELINNEGLRKQMGVYAQKRVKENFTWEKITDKFLTMIDN